MKCSNNSIWFHIWKSDTAGQKSPVLSAANTKKLLKRKSSKNDYDFWYQPSSNCSNSVSFSSANQSDWIWLPSLKSRCARECAHVSDSRGDTTAWCHIRKGHLLLIAKKKHGKKKLIEGCTVNNSPYQIVWKIWIGHRSLVTIVQKFYFQRVRWAISTHLFQFASRNSWAFHLQII